MTVNFPSAPLASCRVMLQFSSKYFFHLSVPTPVRLLHLISYDIYSGSSSDPCYQSCIPFFRAVRSACFLPFFLFVCFNSTFSPVSAANASQVSDFPPWITLTTNFTPSVPRWKQRAAIGIPVGVHSGYDTQQWVAFRSGMFLVADVKKATVNFINEHQHKHSMSAICQESRGPSTMYATGGESGFLYAYNTSGMLQRLYNISNTHDYPSFLSACVQTRYHLLVLDARNPYLYSLPLVDEISPERGMPASTDAFDGEPFVGYRHVLSGDWDQTRNSYNAFGIEWSSVYNDTAFILNWDTGLLYTIQLTPTSVNSTAQQLPVSGPVTRFPGATSLKFDSRNESFLYMTIPHLNCVAVLQIFFSNSLNARFVTYYSHRLTKGVLSVGEYGDYLYVTSARRIDGDRYFSLVQASRYHYNSISSNDVETMNSQNVTVSSPTAIAERTDILSDIIATPLPHGSVIESSPSPLPLSSPLPASNSSESGYESLGTSTSPEPDESDGREVFENPKSDGSGSVGNSRTNSRACFPGSATIRKTGYGATLISHVNVGEQVLSHWDSAGNAVYSEVILFTHQLPSVRETFVKIVTENGISVLLSEGHYVPVFSSRNSIAVEEESPVPDLNRIQTTKFIVSKSVKRGHKVMVDEGRLEQVRYVKFGIEGNGLYNLQTMSGSVVVNGIMMSTFTAAVPIPTAHALLAPLRVLSLIAKAQCEEKFTELQSCPYRWPALMISKWLRAGL